MATAANRCEVCGTELASRAGGRTGRPARFCSNACRQRAYRRRTSRTTAEPARRRDSPLDALIGREHELADLERLIRRARLVTLLGSGGAGKSRIAHELAARTRFPGGVWVVELASLTAGPLLPQHLATTLRIRERPGQAMTDTLADALGAARTLVVLDNCEHVVEATAALTEALLRRCPGLTVLATSRESLELPGERIYRIGELTLPSGTGRGELLASDAVRLFVERARAAAPGFELTKDNGADIVGVCARLDGNPLAIELAARRVRLLPVAEILHRLDDRFDLLTGGSRSALTRHRDLRTAIEWSFDLLEPAEQTVFRRISVLAGGFTVAGAEAVCAGAGVRARDVLDILTSLEAKSLIVAHRGHGRFRQLESIRLYAQDQLTAAGEDDATYERLVTWLLGLAEPILGERVARSFDEIAPLDAERDTLLHALEWTVERGDQRQVLVAAALGRCWRQRGYATEGRRLLQNALAATAPTSPGRSAALAHAAWLATMQGDHAEARALASEALALEDPAVRPRSHVRALAALASAQTEAGDLAGAYASRARCVELVRPLGEPIDTAVCIHNLAYVAVQLGDLANGEELLEECLALYRRYAADPVPAEWVHTSAMLALGRGDLATAEERLTEGLRAQPIRDDTAMPATVGLVMIEGMAVVAARRGDALRAVRLGSAVTALRERQRSQPDASVRQQFADAMDAARGQLGAAARRVAEQAGRRLDAESTVAYTLDDIWREPGSRGGDPVLTRREEAVAALLVAGLSNREIAARLRIAERTVESHLEHIRAKLDLRSRAQIAGWAVAHGVTVNDRPPR
jgi:predicted ATPase/DNA-binding CsgD family transcriptional regulator